MIKKKKIPAAHPFSLDCHVEKFDGKYAVLKNSDPDLGEIRWPIHKLPEKIEIGHPVSIQISNEKIQEEEQYKIMRTLFEDLIN